MNESHGEQTEIVNLTPLTPNQGLRRARLLAETALERGLMGVSAPKEKASAVTDASVAVNCNDAPPF